MSDGTVDVPQTSMPASGPEDAAVLLPGFTSHRPRVVVKADLLPALSALSLVSLLGLPLAWLWAHLAPAEHSTVTADGQVTPLLVESYHEFDSLAIFLLLGLALGALTGFAVWTLRGRRGPVVLIGAVLGSLIAAWLGVHMGASFAAGLYPMPPTSKPGDLLSVAPKVSTMWAVIAQPLGTALVYGLAASWNGLDDLGRRLG